MTRSIAIVLEAWKEGNSKRCNYGGSPWQPAFLTSMGMMFLGRELAFINMALAAIRAIDEDRQGH